MPTISTRCALFAFMFDYLRFLSKADAFPRKLNSIHYYHAQYCAIYASDTFEPNILNDSCQFHRNSKIRFKQNKLEILINGDNDLP